MNTLLLILLASKSWGMYVTCPPVVEGSIDTLDISLGAVDTNRLNNDAVTTAKVLTGAIDTRTLATDSVTTSKLITGAADTRVLATDSVTSAKMLNGAVQTGKLHAEALMDANKSAKVKNFYAEGVEAIVGGTGTAATYISGNRIYLDGGYNTGVASDGGGTLKALILYADVEKARFATAANGGAGLSTALTLVGSSGTVTGVNGFGVIPTGATDTGKIQVGNATHAACLMLGDSDNAGCTECVPLNGVLTCGVDADCVCDGTP